MRKVHPLKAKKGVQQGCILSPQLLNIYREYIIREVMDGLIGGVKVGGGTVTNLRYADNSILVAGSGMEMVELIKRIKIASKKRGLYINIGKMKLMIINCATIFIDKRVK
jgi:hypothetical protein